MNRAQRLANVTIRTLPGTGHNSVRFALWNIQGLCARSLCKLNLQQLNNQFNNYDIVLLTETWTSKQSYVTLEGYENIFVHRTLKKRGSKRNSGGLGVCVKSGIKKFVKFIKNSHDDILWLRISKDLLHTDLDVLLCLCYAVPINSTRRDLVDCDIFDKITNDIADMKNENVLFMVCGDMNARTNDKNDFITYDNTTHLNVPNDYENDVNITQFLKIKVE